MKVMELSKLQQDPGRKSFRGLSEVQIEAAEMLSRGIVEKVILGKIGKSQRTFRSWLKQEKFRTVVDLFASGAIEFAMTKRSAAQILSAAAPKAAETLVTLMEEATKEAVQQSSAEGILDRTGHARKTDAVRTIVHVDADFMRLIEETRRMAANEIVVEEGSDD